MAEVGRLGRGGRGASVDGATVLVRGLSEVQKALRAADRETATEVRKGLRSIGDTVRDKARANVRSRTGKLAGSIRTSATLTRITIYSNLIYSRIQDEGGRVGRGGATLLTRASVSQYMRRAVDGSGPTVDRELELMLGRIHDKFEREI